ncbi:hypothetical protein [Nostoc sp. NZL]|uniref:hypothetical protein n=1 Tax=Nostoc sp. NZL TaxID=2650612 RepID=UPI0018C7D983|nr:hypothetical protein [Nostoc sp. NZL]MBG1240974.1 hypothetical protein [Nostoc sp. NZL]MBG1241000.1 hypothetical protein [Nostoc sp. NZL]
MEILTSQPNTTSCPKCNGRGLLNEVKCDFCLGDGWIEEATEELRYLWMCEDLGILTSEEYQRLQELNY